MRLSAARIITFALTAALFLSCSRPASEASFVKACDADGGVYSFKFNLSDSLSRYDLSFYTAQPCPGMQLKVMWTGPSGQYMPETVYLDGKETETLYRKGVAMAEPGEWVLDVRVSGEPESFRGLGMICERNGAR